MCPICLEPLDAVDYFDCQYFKGLCHENNFKNENEHFYEIEDKMQRSIHDTTICITPCGHHYHYKCIHSWLNEKEKCADCRALVELEKCKIMYKKPSCKIQMESSHSKSEANTSDSEETFKDEALEDIMNGLYRVTYYVRGINKVLKDVST